MMSNGLPMRGYAGDDESDIEPTVPMPALKSRN
jgi:hypothetical protein